MLVDYRLVVEVAGFDAEALVDPVLYTGKFYKPHSRGSFAPDPRLIPVYERILEQILGLLEAFQIQVLPWVVVEVRFAFVVAPRPGEVELDELEIQMHSEKVAVSFPFLFCFYACERMLRVCEVGAKCPLEPENILVKVQWPIVELPAVHTIQLFPVKDAGRDTSACRRDRLCSGSDRKCHKYQYSTKTANAHIQCIGEFAMILETAAAMFSVEAVPSSR